MSDNPLAVLRRIRSPARTRPRPGERCELCAANIPEEHGHVVDLEQRSLRCTCRPCASLFVGVGAAGGRFRTVPERHLIIDDFELSAGQWDALQIPVAMAFFFRNSSDATLTAFYPSPAGATESLLPLGAWDQISAVNPVLSIMEADVEAALIRVVGSTFECFVVPIDACYELVGHLRRLWRGFDGGREARDATAGFFDRLRHRARTVHRAGLDG